jgi:integrase/recombinase XerD
MTYAARRQTHSAQPLGRPCYANGRTYRALHSPCAAHPKPFGNHRDQVISLTSLQLDWPRFWEITSDQLTRHGYGAATTEFYRSALRSFYHHVHARPSAVDAASVHSYIHSLVNKHYSWSWIGMNISVLRTAFDKLGGKSIVTQFATPKRPMRLPEILSRQEARQILTAATTVRDQLLLGLMYGCGIKVGETCRLTWADVDTDKEALRIRYARGTRERTLPLPPDLLPVLALGKARCPCDDYVFQGRCAGTQLSKRTVHLILRQAVQATGILKTVTCMTLRHSFAVHCIEEGQSIRAVQEALGHQSVTTTLIYEQCILPSGVTSPIDTLRTRIDPSPAKDDFPIVEQSLAPTQALFDEPLAIDALELPFRPEQAEGLATTFYRMLKTCILGRFLCSRRATIRAG